MDLPAERLARAAALEESWARACRMQAMSAADLRALFAGEASRAAAWIASAAEHGAPWARLRLGQILLDGTGVAADPAMALAWFRRAADQGLAEAMNMVGRCLENGWGAPPDLAAAADWYRRSAEAGHDWGQYNYAHMLFDGRGVPIDPARAVVWYRRAAEQDHTRAMNLLARCLEEGWGAPPDRALAAAWYRRSAEGGYFRAQFNLGTLLAGAGEIDEALSWFEKALGAASPDSLEAMTDVLIRRPEPGLAGLARRARARRGPVRP